MVLITLQQLSLLHYSSAVFASCILSQGRRLLVSEKANKHRTIHPKSIFKPILISLLLIICISRRPQITPPTSNQQQQQASKQTTPPTNTLSPTIDHCEPGALSVFRRTDTVSFALLPSTVVGLVDCYLFVKCWSIVLRCRPLTITPPQVRGRFPYLMGRSKGLIIC